MTLLFPDVSEYTPSVDVAPYPIVLARATLSDRVADPTYAAYKAKSAGKVFVAYHWLNHGNLAAQARWAFQHVGPDVPLMIDAEDKAGNTGYAGPLTIDDILGFTAAYRALGGIVSLVYLPFWYWSGAMGAPHRLGELTAAGLGLVSSNYPRNGYTDNGPGWAPYYPGAPVPVQWQYTDAPIDMNAYRGTVDEYKALIGLPQVKDESIEVETVPEIVMARGADGTVYKCDGMQSIPIGDPALLDAFRRLDGFGSVRLAKSPTGQAGPGWFAADIADSWSEDLFGRLAAPVDTHAQATDIAQQLVAAGVTGMTPAELTAAIKAGLDGVTETIHTT